MSIATILLPLFVQVVLTFALLLWLGVLRRRDFKDGKIRPQEIALREPRWSPRVQQVAYCFGN